MGRISFRTTRRPTMRRVLVSAVAAALVFTIGCGGPDLGSVSRGVPLTITMPPSDSAGQAVTKVEFPTVDPTAFFERETVRTQYLVGTVGPDPADGRFRFKVDYFVGNSPNPSPQSPDVSFAAESVCDNGGTEGKIDRIACAVVTDGRRLICSAIYDKMDAPPEQCEGTYACVKCPGGVRVCSANPECF